MGSSPRVTYQSPPQDNTFSQFLQYQQQKESQAEARAAQERADERAAAEARKAAGVSAYGSLRSGIENQMRQGLLSYEDATSRLRDYAAKYDMTPPEQDVASLSDLYTKEILPGRRQTAISSAYEEILGRQPTETEKQSAMERFSQGYYTSNQDLRDAMYKGTEYQKKFNTSYLDNYYDTKFGKQATDASGERTGRRTFTFASNLLPSMGAGFDGADLAKRTGVSMPQFGESFTGTPSEIEEQLQNVRDSRQFLYSAGLTNLQGEIDKETQKLRNEGTKEIASMQNKANFYNTMVASLSA